MTEVDPRTVTRLIQRVRDGDPAAGDSLLGLVYAELRAMAAPLFAHQQVGHTLQPTAVVHEAWLKLAPSLDKFEDRRHFYAVASQAMRQVLTDHARGIGREKRGGGRVRINVELDRLPKGEPNVDLVELDEALSKLAELHPRHARVVELRLLGGLTIREVAEVLEVGTTTIEGDWFTAKGWLRNRLGWVS